MADEENCTPLPPLHDQIIVGYDDVNSDNGNEVLLGEHLSSQVNEWCDEIAASFSSFIGAERNGEKLDVKLNHLKENYSFKDQRRLNKNGNETD